MTLPCPQEGTADLYGLGIRLGLYFQWVSTLLVTIFRQEEEALYRVVNLHLQLAVFACLVLLTVKSPTTDEDNTLHPSEVIISLWLLLGGALSSTTGSEGLLYLRQRKLAGLARLAMYTALAGYAVWFWLGGGLGLIDNRDGSMMKKLSLANSGKGAENCDAEKETVAWFGQAGLHSPAIRGFGKAASVGGLIVCVGLTGYCLYNIWKEWMGSTRGKYEAAATDSGQAKNSLLIKGPKQQKKQRPQVEITLVVTSLGGVILSVASVEYVIQANALQGVNDIFAVGQIIPLLVGTMGLLTTVISIFWENRILEPRCVRILGRHWKCQ
ncbi:hypothetical protein V8F20_003007 [Naviculisporaceae sp. PSN 640]